MAEKKNVVIVILIILILLLVGILIYSLVIKPAIATSYVTAQNQAASQGYVYALQQLITQVAGCPLGGVAIPVGNNQSIHLVAIECYQRPTTTTNTAG